MQETQQKLRETVVFAWTAAFIAFFSIAIFPIFLMIYPDRMVRLTTAVSFHAATISAWFIIFGLQPWLLIGNKAKLHRLIGRASIALVVPMVLISLWVSISIAREFPHADAVFIINGFGMLGFVPFYGLAIRAAKRGAFDAHKRLMLFATLFLMAPPIDRFIRVIGLDVDWGLYGFAGFALLVPVGVDVLARGRLHATTTRCLSYSTFVLVAMFAVLNVPDLRAAVSTLLGRNF